MKSFNQDDGVINLRDDDSSEDDAEFRINHIEGENKKKFHK